MSGEYGLKIKNYQAGSIFEVLAGVRDNYDCKDAMLTNSLFLDFLLENGLDVYKGSSTRDVICLEFDYGSRSFDKEISHLKELGRNNRLDYRLEKSKGIEGKATKKKDRISSLYRQAIENADKFSQKSKDEIRHIFYRDGVPITYPVYSKRGKVIGEETIRYFMSYRTAGKAKQGKCMFVCERLHEKVQDFLRMGIKLPKKNAPVVEIGAYSSLITSTIVGRVKIEPEEILILKDVDAKFITNVISIETDEKKRCHAIPRDNYEVKNTIFDGQALIDDFIFPDWGNGYILLRQHFCKAAAFRTYIQKFFKEYYGDEYETATVIDMFGREVRIKDVKLITTDNMCKWIKFKDVTFDYWADRVRANGSLWGIVKTAHPSKLGDVQRMSYQMVNAMAIEDMDDVLSCSVDYIQKLKNDDATYLDYLRKNSNFSNDFEVLVALVEFNPPFIKSDYFRARKKKIVDAYILNLKNGRAIQNADNLVIVGNPYAMLLHAVGEDALSDPTFSVEPGCIQCWTSRFKDGEYLAEFRSPFNAPNSLGYLHNIYHEYMDKYFNLGSLCIAINMIGTDLQDLNNGSDQDSDSLYVTNQPQVVERAKYCYSNCPTFVNNIPKEKTVYSNSIESFATVDCKLQKAQRAIGESSNLAQIALSYSYNFESEEIVGNVCILACLAQCAIDNAKRVFDVDIMSEISRIKTELDVKHIGYPAFWLAIRKGFDKKKINWALECPMNRVYNLKLPRKDYEEKIPIAEFFVNEEVGNLKKTSRKVEELIEKYSIKQNKAVVDYGDTDQEYEQHLLLRNDFEQMIEDIRETSMSKKYTPIFAWLINRAFMITPSIRSNRGYVKTTLDKNRSLLMKTLYLVNKDALLACFSGTPDERYLLKM